MIFISHNNPLSVCGVSNAHKRLRTLDSRNRGLLFILIRNEQINLNPSSGY